MSGERETEDVEGTVDQRPLVSAAFRFGAVGISNFVISFSAFRFLFRSVPDFPLKTPIVQAVSYGVGIIWSFVPNRILTFRSKGHIAKEGTKFLALQLALLLISSLLLAVAVDRMHYNPHISWFIVMAAITAVNFLLCRNWVFRCSGRAR